MRFTFTAYATPQPQGSVRAVPVKGYAHPFLTSDNKKLKSFRQEVAKAAIAAMDGREMAARGVPVRMSLDFYFARPKSAPKRVTEKTTKPDLDKLVRAVFDAVRGIVYQDDSQVVGVSAEKRFALPERVEVSAVFAETDDRSVAAPAIRVAIGAV